MPPRAKGPKVTIYPEQFAAALERLVTEPRLRAQLEAKPADTLKSLGFEIDDKAHAEMAGKRLSQLIGIEMSEVGLLVRPTAYPRTSVFPRVRLMTYIFTDTITQVVLPETMVARPGRVAQATARAKPRARTARTKRA